jgi:hypothetical protein
MLPGAFTRRSRAAHHSMTGVNSFALMRRSCFTVLLLVATALHLGLAAQLTRTCSVQVDHSHRADLQCSDCHLRTDPFLCVPPSCLPQCKVAPRGCPSAPRYSWTRCRQRTSPVPPSVAPCRPSNWCPTPLVASPTLPHATVACGRPPISTCRAPRARRSTGFQ